MRAAVRSRDLPLIDGFNGDDLKALREVKMANQLKRERESKCHCEPIIVNLNVISTVLIAPRSDLT